MDFYIYSSTFIHTYKSIQTYTHTHTNTRKRKHVVSMHTAQHTNKTHTNNLLLIFSVAHLNPRLEKTKNMYASHSLAHLLSCSPKCSFWTRHKYIVL